MNIYYVERDKLFDVVKDKIVQTDTVADIGCGIRPQTFIKAKKHICFEPHQQYIEHVKKDLTKEAFEKFAFINTDWEGAANALKDNSVETVFLLDVIEHLEKEKGVQLLEKTISKATKQVVIFTPYGFVEQNHEGEKDAWGLDGAKWQEHKSGWMPEDFGEAWEFYVSKDFHTSDNMRREYEEPKGAMFAILNLNKDEQIAEPKFSIIIPTYNQADYLGIALDSVLNQSLPFWEAIIVNDGSTDNTKDVIDKYLLLDKRFSAFHKENGGVATALNVGIENARGEWICWLSSDDLFERDKLEVHLNAIQQNPNCKFFHSHWYLLLHANQQKIAPGLWLQIPPTEFQVTRFFWANYIHGNAIAVHRTVFDEVGLFDESLRQGQDFDMWLRISTKFISHFIDKRTCVTRIHPGQTTNSFVEGGVLDSTRALFKFLNSHSFEELFPFSNFKNLNDVLKALNEVIFITTKDDAFLYRCGFTAALAVKTMEWLATCLNGVVKVKALEFVARTVNEYLNRPFKGEVKEILKVFLSRGKVHYENHNIVTEAIKHVKQSIDNGNQQKAIALEYYLKKLTSQTIQNSFSELEYEPVLLGFPVNNIYSPLKPKNILTWNVAPSGMLNNSIRQSLKIKCEACGSEFNIQFEYEMIQNYSENKFICPKCKKGFLFSDKNFDVDFMKFHESVVSPNEKLPLSRRVAFLIPDVTTIGGGTKIAFGHIEWLIKIGCDVTVYSYSHKPEWIDAKIKFAQIKDLTCLDEKKSDLFIVFSIFDIPGILNKVPISKVVHLCQGYEGYHYGSAYDELRSDKHILTKLHAIPVKNISVSKHLVELFKDKFGREVEYIPNGVNHNVFTLKEFSADREKSILFIGNPFHPLKGFQFLSLALKNIQRSPVKIESLKLYIVMGLSAENIENVQKHWESEIGCSVEFQFKLTSKEIAALIKKVSVVVCTSWYEGFSLPVLEAMACGTPTITTNNMGAESFCFDKKNSFVVKYGDIASFSQEIVNILYSRYNIGMILKNAYETSLEYSQLNSFNALVSTYQNLLSTSFEQSKIEALQKKIEPMKTQTENPKTGATDKKNKKTLAVILPVFNQVEFTKDCIDSLKSAAPFLTELIIVNNASEDGTSNYLAQLQNKDDRVKVIENKMNLGFPEAINQGLREVTSDFVVIANNDIIFTEGWATRLIDVAESNPSIGIVGPISNSVSGVQLDKNAKYDSIEQMHKYAEKVKGKNAGKYFEFPRVAFLCTLIKREVIEKIGGLDERFSPGNFEDDDFCLRAQTAGYKTVIAQDVFIHHYGSKSFKAKGEKAYAERLETNKQKFINKWGADPEEIWLKGKSFTKRNPVFPIDKNPFTASMKRALIYLEDKDYTSATYYLNKAIEYFNTISRGDFAHITMADLLNLAGNTALLSGDCQTSKTFFEKELNLEPASSRACVGLGESFYAQEQYEAAKTMFEWAVKNDPQNQVAINSLVKVNKMLNLSNNDNSLIEQKSFDEKIEELFEAAYSFYEQKLFAESLSILTELGKFVETCTEEIHPETMVAIVNLSGYNYLGLNDIDNARESFESALNSNPSSSSACEGLAEIYARFEMNTEAKTMFEWAVKNNPENSKAVTALAKVNQKLGFARTHNSLLLKNVNPIRQLEAKLELAEELIEKEKNNEAEALLLEILESEPSNVIALNNLSVIKIIEEKYDEAVKLITKILAINPEDEIALENMIFLKDKLTSVIQS